MPTIHRRIRDPRIRLVRGEVGQRRSDASGVILKQADSGIAPGTKQAAYRASLMVMIYSEAFLYARVGLGYAKALADRAASVLGFHKRVVFGGLNAEPSAAMRVGRKSVVLLAIIGAPLGVLRVGAHPAKALKAISLLGVSREITLTLNRLAGSAPFHSFWSLWPALRKAVMSAQVIEGLPLNPSPVRSVPGGNWRWSATSALAQAFRYFGHHAIPSLLGFPNNIKGKV